MKQEILEREMDNMLETWRLEEQDKRNRALEERMRVPRTTEDMLKALAALEGLNTEGRRAARAQFSQKVAFIV